VRSWGDGIGLGATQKAHVSPSEEGKKRRERWNREAAVGGATWWEKIERTIFYVTSGNCR
jgi:hypothetical protein